MPLPSFVNSIASKAQAAVQSHLQQPGAPRPSSPDNASQPSANEAAAQGQSATPGQRSHAFGALGHQFRSLREQYGSGTGPVQKIITTEKGLALDFEAASGDLKGQSKEMYTWGQLETEDVKDVTDRLAYLNYIHGSLTASLAQKLDGARAPLKALRDAETAALPRRNIRAGMNTQLARLEHDQSKGSDKRVAELQAQIDKAVKDDAPQENEIEVLKRHGVKRSEQIKWEALREYGEKLVLLSQAASHVIQALPPVPPTAQNPYQGTQATAAARATLQHALDNYTTGSIKLDLPGAGADLSRHDTRSFGQSHSKELASIGTTNTGSQLTPPLEDKTLESAPAPAQSSTSVTSGASQHSNPIDPMALNNAPTAIPSHSGGVQLHDTATPAAPAPAPIDTDVKPTPVVAETGVPISSPDPGPSSGSLLDLKNQRYETAQEEKARLEREEVERARKEMEAGAGASGSGSAKKDDEDLPPYQEL
ncbi:Eisosome component PIL1-domain-containing protein [Flagelloscypha sp. PMI_526]|nr:Eisosome component PIL1-domain-containing protein [Flagelloscypha sp. PMI_526]